MTSFSGLDLGLLLVLGECDTLLPPSEEADSWPAGRSNMLQLTAKAAFGWGSFLEASLDFDRTNVFTVGIGAGLVATGDASFSAVHAHGVVLRAEIVVSVFLGTASVVFDGCSVAFPVAATVCPATSGDLLSRTKW